MYDPAALAVCAAALFPCLLVALATSIHWRDGEHYLTWAALTVLDGAAVLLFSRMAQ